MKNFSDAYPTEVRELLVRTLSQLRFVVNELGDSPISFMQNVLEIKTQFEKDLKDIGIDPEDISISGEKYKLTPERLKQLEKRFNK